ncbi:hypothetical protein A8A54_09945 [Brucella pseudogrignonensis]|uniref:hypothetical protein n=1 Tax=Brucella pseudogrignonensis TaxID=419475 RepID=UPI0007DA4CC0|nr:hypothetical protein [Brucella pseudogrignonensis]ANG96762.1 hypothetical protein A8A54_09945 [Brucella pseudogrignonensis]
MANGIMKINISKRFDRNCKVYAFDVKIDGEVYAEVSKHTAFKLIMQAEDVARELDMVIDVHGQQYLTVA